MRTYHVTALVNVPTYITLKVKALNKKEAIRTACLTPEGGEYESFWESRLWQQGDPEMLWEETEEPVSFTTEEDTNGAL